MKARIPNNREPMFLRAEDSFNFNCKQCGKCCRNREDVLLSGPDIYRASKHLGMTAETFVQTYCEIYIGDSSRIPVCRLKPQGEDRHCPLLKDNKCAIHEAKPAVCALFPLARIWDRDGNAKYFVNSTSGHDTKDRHKVADWLTYGGLPVNDEAGRAWNELIIYAVKFVHDNEQQLRGQVAREIYAFMTYMMYCCYVHDVPIDVLMKANLDSFKDALPRYLILMQSEWGKTE